MERSLQYPLGTKSQNSDVRLWSSLSIFYTAVWNGVWDKRGHDLLARVFPRSAAYTAAYKLWAFISSKGGFRRGLYLRVHVTGIKKVLRNKL